MNLMRSVFLLLFLSALFLPARAQVNTEKLRAFDVDGWAATLGGDVAVRSGNSDLMEVGGQSRIDYRAGKHYTFLDSYLRYARVQDTTFENQAFAHLRYTVQLSCWLATEVFSQIERDGFTRLQVRLLGGAGTRFIILDTERYGLFQGTALMIEYEDLDSDLAGSHPEIVTVGRWSNYLSLRLRFTEQTSFVNTFYAQPQLDAFGDIRLLNEGTLIVALTRHVRFTTTVQFRYDSRPPDTIEPFDLTLRNGLAFSF